MAINLNLEEGCDIEELLGRVSKKLGWLNSEPSGHEKHKKKKKSAWSSSKKGTSKSEKDIGSSSDKENKGKGHNYYDLSASAGDVKYRINYTDHSGLQTNPSKTLHTESAMSDERSTTGPFSSISNNSGSADKTYQSTEETGESCKDAKKDGKDLKDVVFEGASSEECYKSELGNAEEHGASWELQEGTGETARDTEEDQRSLSLNKAAPEAVENSSQLLDPKALEDEFSSLSDDETDFPTEDIQSAISDDKGEEANEPFSPFVPYTQSPEPIKWILTPPPKENLFKRIKSVRKINDIVIISDSDSDSPVDPPSPNLIQGKNEGSAEEFLSPVSEVEDKEPDEPFSPCLHLSETPEPTARFFTPPSKDVPSEARNPDEEITGVGDLDSDSPGDACVKTLSLRERLSKNFKKQKGVGKPASKKELPRNGYLVRSSSSEDGDQGTDDFCSRRHRKTAKERSNVLNPRVSKYDSSDDDDDNFEQFLQAIKTPRHASSSAPPRSPTVDEDQYENSFIDDSPVENRDSEDDVYYYRQINSDQKMVSDKKKGPATKKTPAFSKYRLPQLSGSDDDAVDNVFATPKPPTVKLPNPKVLSSSKKFTPIPSQRSSQTDFLSSLVTPKVGCTSSSTYVRDFKKHREALTQKLFVIYNQTVFDNKLPSDFSIKWNNRMRKTAGYCYYTKTKLGGQCNARIELSEKVCDTAERLRDTLIHELCHAACWLINGVNDGHGRFWKYWAAKSNQAHPSIPVIKRCHSYEISTKYKYQCVLCKTTIGRHSKSINTAKFCCAYCKGNLVLLPVLGKDGKVAKGRTPNKFAMFVKENYGSVKKGNTSMKHADIMRLLSQDFSKKATVSV